MKVHIATEVCKGCGLCINACPKKIIAPAPVINGKGYHPAALTDGEACILCASCARICPDTAIEIY